MIVYLILNKDLVKLNIPFSDDISYLSARNHSHVSPSLLSELDYEQNEDVQMTIDSFSIFILVLTMKRGCMKLGISSGDRPSGAFSVPTI